MNKANFKKKVSHKEPLSLQEIPALRALKRAEAWLFGRACFGNF